MYQSEHKLFKDLAQNIHTKGCLLHQDFYHGIHK